MASSLCGLVEILGQPELFLLSGTQNICSLALPHYNNINNNNFPTLNFKLLFHNGEKKFNDRVCTFFCRWEWIFKNDLVPHIVPLLVRVSRHSVSMLSFNVFWTICFLITKIEDKIEILDEIFQITSVSFQLEIE